MNNELLTALHKIAEANACGDLSFSVLEKACNNYKIKDKTFVEDEYYHLCLSKSIMDHINGIEIDDFISKAILPGQTKVVDGVVYIWTATPGAKTDYDWRVYVPAKGGKLNTSKQTSKSSVNRQKYVNELFPKDIKSLKDVKKLGGSTGAKLVEDADGAQYVMKSGVNTNNGHVESEYIANQLYHILGCRVPDFELYKDGSDSILLSKFLTIQRPVDQNDYHELAKNFAVDVLLANWDVYNNDNCLVDAAGRIVRVDNGGSLFYRAQGGTKNFDDVKKDWDNMLTYNPSVVADLTPEDFVSQIDEVLSKKDAVLGLLEQIGDDKLLNTLENRIDGLEKLKSKYETIIKKQNKKSQPRVLLPADEMYRELTEEELEDAWVETIDNIHDVHSSGASYIVSSDSSIMLHKSELGWEFLSNICKKRGFDARPEVLTDEEYWKLLEDTDSKHHLYRGIESKGNISGEEFADKFLYDDECYYGTLGAYGAGIYSHCNDSVSGAQKSKSDYTYSGSWGHARNYAGSGGAILQCILDKDAKIISCSELEKELENAQFVKSSPKLKSLEDEANDVKKELIMQKDNYQNFSRNISQDTKQSMKWDEYSLTDMNVFIDSENWAAKDKDNRPAHISFEDFTKKLSSWIKANGGTITPRSSDNDVFDLSLPNSKREFVFSKFQFENRAIKQKDQFSKAYHFHVENFRNWVMNEHYNLIEKSIKKKIEESQPELEKTLNLITDLENRSRSLSDEISDEMSKMSKNNILSKVKTVRQQGYKEALGIYAAIKGYDAFYAPDGNSMGNTFMVILNRSKIKVRNTYE